MTVAEAKRLTAGALKVSGAYLTDGARLYRVVEAGESMVALENCRAPSENPSWVPVSKVLKSMRLVRPSS